MEPYYTTDLGALYHGDCLDIIPQLEPVDCVVTDPPYGIDYQSTSSRTNGERYRELPKIANDSNLDFMPELLTVLDARTVANAHVYLFCHWSKWPLPCEPFKLMNMVVWDKMTHGMGDTFNTYAPTHELIAFMTKGRRGFENKRPCDVIRHPKIGSTNIAHPSEKPIGLLGKLIQASSKAGQVVLDAYLGSGSTAVACELLGRRWIGIEIAENYCEMAAQRLENERRQLKLF